MKFVLVLCHCSVIRNRITRDALIMHHTSSNNINGIFSHSERVVWRAANCGKSADRNRINRWMPASGPEKVDSSGGVFVPRQVCFFLYFLLIALSLSLILSRSPAPFLSLRSCLAVPVLLSLSCCPCLFVPVSPSLRWWRRRWWWWRSDSDNGGGGGGSDGVTVVVHYGPDQRKTQKNSHLIIHFPKSEGVSEWANE